MRSLGKKPYVEAVGYRFRSRTEAKWAVFFTTLKFRWEYEPEGFKLSSGQWYLPDFKFVLPNDVVWYAEVKYAEHEQFEGETIDIGGRNYMEQTVGPVIQLLMVLVCLIVMGVAAWQHRHGAPESEIRKKDKQPQWRRQPPYRFPWE